MALDRRNLPAYAPRDATGAAFDIRDQPPFAPREQLHAPEGAPNVLLILIDDMGFGAPSAFGGPCAMPAADALAEGGLRYSRFHTTAVCSPTRAALMTGRNHHSVGMGALPGLSSDAPGYDTYRPLSAGTIAQTLRYNGYATGMFGKWHQTPADEIRVTGPFDRWPTGEGFERFYGFHGGLANQFSPQLVDGTRFIEPPATEEEGYHLSEDLVDQAQEWIRQLRLHAPGRPWFTYLAFGATHSPHHVPCDWRARYRGQFGHGWDEQRERTLARQKELGVVPPETELAPWVRGVPHWDELDDTQRHVGARMMENYAAFAEHTDAQVARLIEFLRDGGQLDNTLVFYILGDNGASPEGGFEGAVNERRRQNGLEETSAEMLSELDELGGPRSNPHYPTGWALALDSPYQWAKIVASHYGGTRNGLIVHWPKRISARGEIRHQWHHVIDVAPTIYEAVGVPHPDTVDGIPQDPIEGTSFLYTFADPDAAERHTTQYFEVFGNRGVYHEGWTAVVHHLTPWEFFDPNLQLSYEDDRWELYDTAADWSQARDLSAEYPEKLAELQQLFLAEARKHKVLPLDDRNLAERRQPADPVRSIVITPQDRHLSEFQGLVPSLRNTSFRIDVDLEAASETSDGVLAAHGSWNGGWSLHASAGHPVYTHNMLGLEWTHVEATGTIPAGRHTVSVLFDYDGGGRGRGGSVRLLIDGEQVGSGRVERTIPGFIGTEYLEVGIDRGSPVTDRYNRGGGSPYTDVIKRVSIVAGDDAIPPARDEATRTVMSTQ
jgi:arylsulfatase A-like enzyme